VGRLVLCAGVILPVLLPAAPLLADAPPPRHYRYDIGYAYAPSSLEWRPFRVWAGLMIVDVELDGRIVPALLDTGSTTVLARDAVTDQDSQTDSTVHMATTGGSFDSHFVIYKSLKFGGVRIEHGAAPSVSFSHMGFVPFRMIVGSDILANFALQVDWSRHQLRVLMRGDSLGGGTVIPVAAQPGANQQLFITTRIDLCGRSIPAYVDTGAAGYATIDSGAIPTDRCPAQGQSDIVSSGAGGAVLNPLRGFARVSLGPQSIGALPLALNGAANSLANADNPLHATLDNTLLSHFNYTMDATGGRLVLWGPAGHGGTHAYGLTGLQVTFLANGPPVVFHVMAHSPAADAGIVLGDKICSINAQLLTRSTMGKLIVNPPVGQPLAVSLCGARNVTVVPGDFLGERAGLAAMPMPAEHAPQAGLTQLMIECAPDDEDAKPKTGQGDPQACRTALTLADLPLSVRLDASQALANIDLQRHDFAQALVAAGQAVGIQDGNAASILLLAKAHAGLGQRQQAREEARKALALDPALQEARDLLADAGPSGRN
jgi:predicted aspartyl protease